MIQISGKFGLREAGCVPTPAGDHDSALPHKSDPKIRCFLRDPAMPAVGKNHLEPANPPTRRAGLLKAPAIAPSNASTGMTMSLPRWANRQPPTRAASSLVRALRYARGTLLFATWTSRCDRASGQ